jgi:hypothetical protein
MNTIMFQGKCYKEFKLPDEGMFFNKGVVGLVWNNWDNEIKDVRN